MQHFSTTAAGRLLLCFLFLWWAPALRAQIAAPDLMCTNTPVGEVELVWANVSSSCGAFGATEIFRAPQASGPFTRIAEITDPAATTYTDPNPTGALRYYFLRYRYACPGLTPLNSDTLETLIPRAPRVRYVGVEADEIVLAWEPSLSPEVTGYTVLEVTPTGFLPLATVFGVTEFRVPFGPADPTPTARRFRLVSVDACGNESAQGNGVAALRLSGTGGGGCTNVVTLDVDQERLANFLPATGLELFVAFDGGAFVSAGTFSPAATTVAFRDANDGQDICFYVEAVLAGNAGRARSATYCQTIDISQPLRDFPLYGVELDDEGNLLFQYGDDPLQPVPQEANLLLTRSGNQLETVTLPQPVFGVGGQLTLAPLPRPLVSGETIRFRLTDSCGREVTTNAVEPVYLTARSFGTGSNQLTWTPLVNGLNGTVTYDVFRADDGMMLTALASGLTDSRFNDTEVTGGGEVCYKIRARFRPTGGGPAETFVFSSNRVCVVPTAEAYVPNAFSPSAREADNRVFRPFFSVSVDPADYHLTVYDRWGGLVFRTDDPLAGWDGTADGQAVTTGTYLYILTFRAAEGDLRQRSGTVNLLR